MIQCETLFGAPIWTCTLEKITDQDIKEVIEYTSLLKEKDKHGRVVSNHGGWQSPIFILQDNSKDMPKIITKLLNNIEEKLLHINNNLKIDSFWLNISNNGASNLKHLHGDSTISGAYYLKVPKPEADIVFYSDRKYNQWLALLGSIDGYDISYTPEVNGLIMFPGWLEHSVNINQTYEDRISLSFNAT
jgi:uncharacterized protein (TIGR02466 family)